MSKPSHYFLSMPQDERAIELQSLRKVARVAVSSFIRLRASQRAVEWQGWMDDAEAEAAK
jgi:hypothetical protein